jgi:hypothetical protein
VPTAVVGDDDPTVFIVSKCLKRGVSTEAVLADVVGPDPWSKVLLVPHEVTHQIPTGLPVDFPRGPPVTFK